MVSELAFAGNAFWLGLEKRCLFDLYEGNKV